MDRKLLPPCNADRLTNLPDELLGRILSMLPTKDAATVILCKRMRNCLGWISSIDLDDSPIIHCLRKGPYREERFHVFESFVDNVLKKFTPPYDDNTKLTRFRLHFGGDVNTDHEGHSWYCHPHVSRERLNAWISCPLFHYDGLRELDLSFHVRRPSANHGFWRPTYPSNCELPPSLFACQSLQVLRLASYFAIDNAKIPVICFPNLNFLHLGYLIFNDDDLIGRLVSSCPVLQYLSIDHCLWQIGDQLSISSPSLQSLVLIVRRDYPDEYKGSDLVLLNTPNLQYLEYHDNVPARYSIAHMNALVKAFIDVIDDNVHFEAQFSLISAMSHVQDLSIYRSRFQDIDDFWDQLPVFRNLRSLQLDALVDEDRWDAVLLMILHRSPSLETLVFVEGLFRISKSPYVGVERTDAEMAALEAEGWRTAGEAIPSCCLTHLKRIVFECCYGSDRELNAIKFFLANSFVLEELVICLSIASIGDIYEPCNLDQFEIALKDLPRVSNSCLITLQHKMTK